MAKLTNKSIENDPSMFPPPAIWMSWTADMRHELKLDANGLPVTRSSAYGHEVNDYEVVVKSEGKIRHHYTRAEARKALMWVGSASKHRKEEHKGLFMTDWAVYEFVDGEWVLRGAGAEGEERKTNPFFAQKVTPDERVHPFEKAAQDKAIESILRAVS